jgi:hypothetical protein
MVGLIVYYYLYSLSIVAIRQAFTKRGIYPTSKIRCKSNQGANQKEAIYVVLKDSFLV